MPTIKSKCPVTGKGVPIGIAMDLEYFESANSTEDKAECSHFGRSHTWCKRDAFTELSERRRGAHEEP